MSVKCSVSRVLRRPTHFPYILEFCMRRKNIAKEKVQTLLCEFISIHSGAFLKLRVGYSIGLLKNWFPSLDMEILGGWKEQIYHTDDTAHCIQNLHDLSQAS